MFGISAFAQAPFAALGENVVVVSLTGVVASGNVGSVTENNTVALSGVVASGEVGTVIYNELDATSGDEAVGLVGTVAPALTVALTGVAASGLLGSLSGLEAAITNVTASGSVGTVTNGGVVVALSGVGAAGGVGTVERLVTEVLTGTQAVGISCSGTGIANAFNILQPLLNDNSYYVRQGALLASGLIYSQVNSGAEAKVTQVREEVDKAINDKDEHVLVKFGALIAKGFLELGGRNGLISLVSRYYYLIT